MLPQHASPQFLYRARLCGNLNGVKQSVMLQGMFEVRLHWSAVKYAVGEATVELSNVERRPAGHGVGDETMPVGNEDLFESRFAHVSV